MMPFSCAACSASAIWRAIATVSRAAALPPLIDRRGVAIDEFENEELRAVRLFEAVDRGDMGMIERGEHLRLPLEPGDALGVWSAAIRQDLDRDVATELRVARAIDFAHPARAERRDDLVGAKANTSGEGRARRSVVQIAAGGGRSRKLRSEASQRQQRLDFAT